MNTGWNHALEVLGVAGRLGWMVQAARPVGGRSGSTRTFHLLRSFRILHWSIWPPMLFLEGGGLMRPNREPTPETSERARKALRSLQPVSRTDPLEARVSIRSAAGEKVSVALPAEAFRALVEVLAQLGNGSAVTIVPLHAELTTQQAADFLNVSRPFLIGLLDAREIPHRKVGTHRRVRMADLVDYKERDDAERRAVAEELAAEAQKHGLGY